MEGERWQGAGHGARGELQELRDRLEANPFSSGIAIQAGSHVHELLAPEKLGHALEQPVNDAPLLGAVRASARAVHAGAGRRMLASYIVPIR